MYLCHNDVIRYILVKYSHRGLADDVLWFNGGLKLFNQLFWTLYLTFLLLPQAVQMAKLSRDELNINSNPRWYIHLSLFNLYHRILFQLFYNDYHDY